MKDLLLAILFLFAVLISNAQNADKPFIRLVDPERETNNVHSARQFLSGSTCKNCTLKINGLPVKVYPTGGFAYEMNLKSSLSVFTLVASRGSASVSKKLTYNFSLYASADTVSELEIVRIETFPEGNLVVQAGDRIKFKVKALPGCMVIVNGLTTLYEQPPSVANKMPGIYQGEYIVRSIDSFSATRLAVTIKDDKGNTSSKLTEARISMLSTLWSDMMVTKGRLAHLLFGLGEDRLGGAKIGYLDSMVPLKVIGKVGSNYKVRLSKFRSAYIPDDLVDFLPKGTFTPESLTGNWRVYGDSNYDYVEVALFSRLPYQSRQLIDSAKIVVDIFGATSNTNWIMQYENTKEIKNVYYEQVEDEVLRVTIDLKHQQHWGHSIYYNNNKLTIRIKRQPADLSIRNLRIAVDAGHGGSNTGAGGPTGSIEKALTLAVSLKLQKALEQEGAKVIMSRTTEKFFDNKDRILFYRDSVPDLLISIHLNSSGDPIHVGGTSTYYKEIGFRKLSLDIYKHMLTLGLPEWGNTGSFNFMLNSPTEYPNALVEMLFLSNPEEEAKILDEDFQQQVAVQIVLGIKDFLQGAGAAN